MFLFRSLFPQFVFEGDPGGGGGGDPTPPAADPPKADPPKPSDQTVPYERFTEVNEQLKAAREEAATLKAAQTEAQRKGLSELDRVKAELADAQAKTQTLEAERDKASGEVTSLTRGGWVRSAATAAGFHDPEDAIARIDLTEVRTEDGAKREVEALAERAKHLVRSTEEKAETKGGDLLQQVLERGKPAGENGDGNGGGKKDVIPAEEFNNLKTDQLVALQEADPELYRRSLSAAAKAAA